jgi:hypothetical protein
MSSPHHVYEAAAISRADGFMKQIRADAEKLHVSPQLYVRFVVGQMLGEEKLNDGRAREWRVRLRLYNYLGSDEPEADSDDTLLADQPGATIIRGLSNVVAWVIELATNYHGVACAGLEEGTLRKKIPTLRTQMSNRGDRTGVIRATYEVIVNGEARHMLARIDVCRADRVDDEPPRRLPGGYSAKPVPDS